MNSNLTAQILFWLSAAALFYTYAGYPLLVWVVSQLHPRRIHRGEGEPSITIIITAYNEERDLKAKLENTLALDYPRELLEIVVASDCSTDHTDEIAREFSASGVKLIRQPQRFGKTAAQNRAVETAAGEIIVFSDATSHYEANVLRAIVPNFSDASVGCVAGQLVYIDKTDSEVGRGAQSYWSYESFLRRHESRACSLIGAPGCLYAVRKSAYVPLYHEACSDFIIATKMVEQGLRAVYEPAAICTEETNRRTRDEFKMRVRVIAQTLTDLWRHRPMMNPFRSGFYAVELFSHKVMRYAVPLFLFAALASSAALAFRAKLFLALMIAQLAFYFSAVVGLLLERSGVRYRLLSLPHYFVLANLASVFAFHKFLNGHRYATWEPMREPAQPSVAKS
jgi:cellulose synthase/poly-beta-1,6-N-acetylglucosamine synthase-like glycosyltransferase